MSEVQRIALARSLASRLACLGLDELRLIDHLVARLELGRERYGELDLSAPRDWSKELGEELVDALVYHAARELAAQDLAREGLREAARLEMLGESDRPARQIEQALAEYRDREPRFHRVEVTPEQLAAAQRDPKLLAQIELDNETAIAAAVLGNTTPGGRLETILHAAQTGQIPNELARELLDAPEFPPDQHLTRVSTEPARIAATPDASGGDPYEDVEVGGESG